MSQCICKGMIDDCPLCYGEGIEFCSLCHGTRSVVEKVAPYVYQQAPCPKCSYKEHPQKATITGMRQDMMRWKFSSLVQGYPFLSQVAATVQEALVKGRGWVVMYGPYGTGKTYLMACAMNSLQPGAMGHYTIMADLLQDLQDAQTGKHRAGRTFNSLMRELTTMDLLCIDEFGEWNRTDWRASVMRQLLVSRSDTGGWLPTFFATNKADVGLEKDFPWLLSRFNSNAVSEFDFSSMPDLRETLDGG